MSTATPHRWPQRQPADHDADVPQMPVCFFTMVRYVADTLRDEQKNIGVLLVCPEREFGGAEFNITRSGIPSGTPLYAVLDTLLRQYRVALPGRQHQPSLFTPVPVQWTRSDLETLHRECSNAIQFTLPAAALGEPYELLQRLFRERVAPRREEAKSVEVKSAEAERMPAVSPKVTARILRRRLAQLGKRGWVQEDAIVEVGGQSYRFDVAVQNGHLHYAVETLSFHSPQAARLLRAEQAGAWYARVWPGIAHATGAHGLLLIEPPEPLELASTRPMQEAKDEFQRVTDWASDAGIDVRQVQREDEVEAVAEEIATALK